MLLTGVAAFSIITGTAGAAGSPIMQDCVNHAELTRAYPLATLRAALATLPADIKEYTNCYDVIGRAIRSDVAAMKPPPAPASAGSSDSFLPAPVIAVIVLLAIATAAFGGLWLRRRRA